MRTLNYLFLALFAATCTFIVVNRGLLAIGLLSFRPSSLTAIESGVALLVFSSLFVMAEFFVLGCLLYSSYHVRLTKTNVDERCFRRWPVVLVGLCLAVALCGLQMRNLPDMISLVLPSLGVLLGVWVSSNCWRGRRAAMWLAPKLVVLAMVIAGLAGVLLHFATSDVALALEPTNGSADEKARLAERIRGSEYLEGGQRRLRLSEKDVNLLMAVALERLPIDGEAIARLRAGTVGLDISVNIPRMTLFGSYINCQGVYHLEIQDGDLAFRPIELCIGRLKIPQSLLGAVGDGVVNTARSIENTNTVIEAIRQIHITDGEISVVFLEESLRRGLKKTYQEHLGESQAVVDATSVHLRHLVKSAAESFGAERQFPNFLHSAFAFARDRSLKGHDAVVENRAAILSLAIVLGHHHVETFVGEVTDESVRAEAGKYQGRVLLRGRRDWTRHFLVSAGLALTLNSGVSDGAGLFKEEIDSAERGSGFSFSDLLADRAGVRFAVTATRDRAAAERTQKLLADQVLIDDVFPPAADLPEGLRDATFQLEFGGVGGEGYNQILKDIERRLDACRALNHQPRQKTGV